MPLDSSIASVEKSAIIGQHARHTSDTGSSEVQIAILTQRIEKISLHLRQNKKDYSGRRGLLMLIARRNALLLYLFGVSKERYLQICNALGLRIKLK